MAELGAAPGAALLDLSMRRRDHRHFAARCWILWALGLGVSLAASGGLAEWGVLVVGIVGILGAGLSVPAAASTLVAWLLAGLVATATPWRDTPGAAATVGAAVLCAACTGVLRYRRDASVWRYLVTMLCAPVVAVLALVPMMVLAMAVYAVISGAGLGGGIQFGIGLTEFVLMGMVWGAAVTVLLALVQGVRELFSR